MDTLESFWSIVIRILSSSNFIRFPSSFIVLADSTSIPMNQFCRSFCPRFLLYTLQNFVSIDLFWRLIVSKSFAGCGARYGNANDALMSLGGAPTSINVRDASFHRSVRAGKVVITQFLDSSFSQTSLRRPLSKPANSKFKSAISSAFRSCCVKLAFMILQWSAVSNNCSSDP